MASQSSRFGADDAIGAGDDVQPPGRMTARLRVRITEAQGLVACTQPYLIVSFQGNQAISGAGNQPSTSPNYDADQEPQNSRASSSLPIPFAITRRGTMFGPRSPSPSPVRMTCAQWDFEACFDVLADEMPSELRIDIHDRPSSGLARPVAYTAIETKLPDNFWSSLPEFYPLQSHLADRSQPSGSQAPGKLYFRASISRIPEERHGPGDFEILRLVGRGTLGQVYQVRKRDTSRVYAMKALSKRALVRRGATGTAVNRRNILVRASRLPVACPFVAGLKFAFQTPSDLYLITDYLSGGELFLHLQRLGRFPEHQARFYIAELILAIQYLHQHDIFCLNLKPECILLDAVGHIVLNDFGVVSAPHSGDQQALPASLPEDRYSGYMEYLAPEILLKESTPEQLPLDRVNSYSKVADFWTLGVLAFEMISGWSPFYAEDQAQMTKNILFGKARLTRDCYSEAGRQLLKGLLNRNVTHRLGWERGTSELMKHEFFASTDWAALQKKEVDPPMTPTLYNTLETEPFDVDSALELRLRKLGTGIAMSTPLDAALQVQFSGFTFVDESELAGSYRYELNDPAELDDDEDWGESSIHSDVATDADSTASLPRADG